MHDFQSVLDLSPNVWTLIDDCTSRKVIIPQDLPEKLFVLPVCKSKVLFMDSLIQSQTIDTYQYVANKFCSYMKWNAIPITVAKLTKCQQTNVQDCGVYCLYFMNTVLKYFRRRSCVMNERFIQYVEERELTYRKATNFRGFLLDIVFDNRENVSNTTH
ncbi:uncharacterized protein [Ptychodera flava]|uniref:uncharacterized protein isoform X2 n=1 Tax=Ptychodera flava TaxID=63121 RepID=UPI00396A4CD2